MSKAPLMPMATAVWLVENTTLTFKQIANFCKLHEVEIQGIADGEVAKGIVGYNPIMSGQLSREEIELSSNDEHRPLNIINEENGLIRCHNTLSNLKKWSSTDNKVQIDSPLFVNPLNTNNRFYRDSINYQKVSIFLKVILLIKKRYQKVI